MSTENHSRDIDAPPEVPTLVRCGCCGEEYDSYLLIPVVTSREKDGKARRWCCPTDDCEGHGYGHDIKPLDEGDLEGPDWSRDSHDQHAEFHVEFHPEGEPEYDEAFEAEMAAWESLEPEFSPLLGCDIDYRSLRIDGLLDDPTPPQRFDFDDISEDDIPF